MVEPVRARRVLGRGRQPEEIEPCATRPFDGCGVHPVVPDVEEPHFGGGPGELGTDPGRIAAVAQGSDIDHRHLVGGERLGPRARGHFRTAGANEGEVVGKHLVQVLAAIFHRCSSRGRQVACGSGPNGLKERIRAAESVAYTSPHPSPISWLADADPLAVTGRTPSSRFNVVSTTPSASFGPFALSLRRLDALATKIGDGCGLALRAVEAACGSTARDGERIGVPRQDIGDVFRARTSGGSCPPRG